MKQDANPIVPGPSEAAPAPRPGRRGKPGKGRGLQKPELKLTAMIDVVFLLLIFFVVTASFQIDEGTLLATLPGDSAPVGATPPPIPVLIDLDSADDGRSYRLLVNGVEVAGASELSGYMINRVRTGQMSSEDLVKINPQGTVRWQHVLNVYNACVAAELEQVAFAAR